VVENQYPETVRFFSPEIERVKAHLREGRPASEIANALHAQGLSAIQLLVIFLEATGAPLRDLKAFGQWWGHQGVTDPQAFDAWAAVVLQKQRTIPSSR
jgi:hypothetical protein